MCDVAVVPDGFEGAEPTPDLPRGPDVVGELWIKGPNVVRGYWNKPEATAATFTAGWPTPATSPASTKRASSTSMAGPRTWSSGVARTSHSVEVEAALFEHPWWPTAP